MFGRKSPHASIQALLLDVEAIRDDVLLLRGGDTRAVLEIAGVNLALKSAEEREALLDGYRALLNGLDGPVQAVCHTERRDLDAYVGHLRAALRDGPPSEALARLALDHVTFVQQLAVRRALLRRRCFLVLPGPSLSVGSTRRGWGRLLPFSHRHSGAAPGTDEAFAAASRQLDGRAEELRQALLGLGLGARRLGGHELARALQTCVAPEQAARQPLADGSLTPFLPVVRGRAVAEVAHASA